MAREHSVQMSKNQVKKSFLKHKRAQFEHVMEGKKEAAKHRKEQKAEARKEKMAKRAEEKKRKEGEEVVLSSDDDDEEEEEQEQVAPAMEMAPPAPSNFTATTTEQQQRAPVAPSVLVAPRQVHMTPLSQVEKELAEHRAWVDRMCAPPPEAAEEEMPDEDFQPPQAGTTSSLDWALDALADYDDDLEVTFN